jgi:flagellar biosynthesis/type III secretory pathway protein FliH
MGRLLKGKGYVVPREVMSARDQARAVLAAAHSAAEEDRRQGYEMGLVEGREAARAEMTELLVKAQEDAEQLRAASKEAAIPIARRMAERIVGRALELHPSLIADIATQALGASRARSGSVVLRVNAADLAALERERPRLVARLGGSLDLQVVADEAVAQGGCIVETNVGRLDARLDRQLDAIEKALGQKMGGPRS